MALATTIIITNSGTAIMGQNGAPSTITKYPSKSKEMIPWKVTAITALRLVRLGGPVTMTSHQTLPRPAFEQRHSDFSV
jgi:hypothetical protein